MPAQFLEIFPPLVEHTTAAEPSTLSYYFFTNTAAGDHFIYGFEGYPDAASLTEVHSKSEPYTRQSAILAEEKLCTVDVDRFRPVAGFLLRDGAAQEPAEVVGVTKVPGGEASKAALVDRARAALENEADGTATFVVMEHLETGELWTFERYATRAWYEQRRAAVAVEGAKASEYVEAKVVGFVQK